MAGGKPIYGSGLLALQPEVSASALSGFQGGLAGAMTKIGKAAAAVFVAGFAVAVAAGVKGIGAWAELEKGMNEVFTLLPGISKDAMGDMTQDVRDFSKEFAVLPDEVVPALYAALSAGVPKDNVFDFMADAQKAAVGGVTELDTAVSAITGVVNAYGSDIISSGEASDLMFTTVAQGVTTFGELAGSLGDVTPISSALGVSFADVSAAMATSTKITQNTSKSATGLKGLLSELGKEGQVAARHFEDAAGKSFPEFIASGGDLAGALDIMKGAADESGGSILDLFGSVEAGAAALQLTGSDDFTNNLEKMADSAGATDAAYDTMDSGLSRTWDRIKVTFNDAFLEIGERLAPHVQQFSTWFAERLPQIIENVTVWFETKFLPAVSRVFDFFKTQVVPVIQNQVIPAFQAVAGFIRGMVDRFKSLSPEQKKFLTDIALAAGAAIAAGIGFMKVVGAFKAISAAFKAMRVLMMANPWVLLIAAVIALVVLIVRNWDTIKEFLFKAWDAIKKAASAVGDWISTAFGKAVDFVKNLFLNFTPLGLFIKHMDKIKSVVTGVKDWISDRISDIVGFFKKMPQRISNAVGGLFDGLKNAFKNAVNWVIKKWNNFKLEIQLPSLLGGGTIGINTPNIPLFHDGGMVEGPPGAEMLAILEAGERVLSKAEVAKAERPLPETKGGITIERLEVHNPVGEPTERSLQTAALAVAVSGYVNR